MVCSRCIYEREKRYGNTEAGSEGMMCQKMLTCVESVNEGLQEIQGLGTSTVP